MSSTLWIGNVTQSMDENFVRSLFMQEATKITNIKLIRDKHTMLPLGYGFIEFADQQTAARVLQNYNGKPMAMGINGQAVNFRLNWAKYKSNMGGNQGGGMVSQPTQQAVVKGDENTIFVGDIGPEVDDSFLFATFSKQFKSTKSAKVITDNSTGQSKGYGFVKFDDPNEYLAALRLSGTVIGSRVCRISSAVKRAPVQQQQFNNPQQNGNPYWNQQFQYRQAMMQQRGNNNGYQYPQQVSYGGNNQTQVTQNQGVNSQVDNNQYQGFDINQVNEQYLMNRVDYNGYTPQRESFLNTGV